MKLDVINFSNKVVGNVELDDAIFATEVRQDLIFRTINWQLAKRRQGTHLVKTRGTVKHTTKKPFKQKGTGSARQGMRSTPNLRGGGVAMGPVLRSHAHKLQKKVRILALKSAISSKAAEGKLIVLDSLDVKSAKTKDLAKQVQSLGWDKALIIDGAEVAENFKRASSNIHGIDVLPAQGANVYDIIRRDTLVLTKAGVEKLTERLK
ncbi:MAG: 50S ribosomal protein L4 [Alphaproteobacteria bacterium]